MNISYTRTGGNKPPLIMLHGLTGSGVCWAPIAQGLTEKYDVILPDARGHGKSSRPNKGYRYEDHANDVVGLIASLKLSISPILVGHSMGGMTAALVASNQQKLLRGIILADPTFLSPTVQREVYESDVSKQHQQFIKKSFNEVLLETRLRYPNRSFYTCKLIAQARYQTHINAFQVLKPPNPEFKQLISTITIPSLLVTGDMGIVTPEVSKELQSLNSRLRVAKITKVGHGLQYDQPMQFLMIIQSFLGRLMTHTPKI